MYYSCCLYLLQSIAEVPYIMEEIVNEVKEESSSEVKLQLLTATMKLFFKRPPECQDILGRLLEYIIGERVWLMLPWLPTCIIYQRKRVIC